MDGNFKLLKPDIVKGYMEGSQGMDEYRYLHVQIGADALEHDIAAGAVQFRECQDAAARKKNQFIVIDCPTEEEGLKAVSYLEACFLENDITLDDEEDEGSEDDEKREESWFLMELNGENTEPSQTGIVQGGYSGWRSEDEFEEGDCLYYPFSREYYAWENLMKNMEYYRSMFGAFEVSEEVRDMICKIGDSKDSGKQLSDLMIDLRISESGEKEE